MTCVIGLIKDNKVFMGSDSASSNESIQFTKTNPKIFIKDEMIFGCTTSFRMINLLQYQFKIPFYVKNISVDEYINTVFIEKIRKLFGDSGFTSIENNVETGGEFIVGFKNNLYHIEPDFQIGKHLDSFVCVGSGMEYAYGAMKILIKNKEMNGIKMITEALKASEYYNPFVRRPFKIESI